MKIKFRNAIFVFLTIGMILIGAPLYGEQTPQDPCDMKRLPASIREILQKKFSAWRLLTLKVLSKEDQLFWTRSGKQNECPGMAFGHYEVQTAFSYVLSLVPQIGRSTGYRLVMFSPGEKNQYQEDVLENIKLILLIF